MRVRASDERDTYTVERLVGGKTGLLQRVEFTTRSRDAGETVVAKVAASTDPAELGVAGVSRDLSAVGKGATKQEALRSVVGEYVERYCAFGGLPESIQSRGSYESMTERDVSVPAFDALVHYTDEQYREEGTEPLTRETRVRWATGTDLTSGDEITLPSWLADSRNDGPHGFASSNGCAAGQSLTAAAYRGLLEVIERDALMRCWYAKTTPDRIRLDEFPTLRTLRDDCEPADGRVELLALDSDLPFTVVAAVLVGASETRPKFLVAASARLGFEEAVADALEELSQQVQVFRRLSLVGDPAIADDDRLDLGENGLYYADPANFETVEWLVSGEETTPKPGKSLSPGDSLSTPDSLSSGDSVAVSDSVPSDLGARLDAALDAFERAQMAVVCYEVTEPHVAEIGLQVVKMVVPDLAPLSHPERPAANHDRLPDDATSRDPHPIP
jgi:ribosomal protein S12 methylthiotransferase accessory factor